MKKYFISALAIAAIATACNVTIESESINPVDEYTLQIRGNIADLQNANTKTAITEDGSKFHSAWVNGDVIRVDVDDLSHKNTATYNSGTGLFTCSITELSEGDHNVNAAYPYAVGVSSSKYTYTIPTSQTMPSINAFDPSADYLVAQTQVISVDGSGSITSVDMNFRRLVSIVKIIPVDGTSSPEKSLAGLKIKGVNIDYPTKVSTKIKITPGDEEATIDTGASSFSVSYAGDDFEFNANTSGTNGAYFIFAPGKFTNSKALTISIVTEDKDKKHYTISKTIASLPSDITFGENELRPITVTFTDSNVEVVDLVPTVTASDIIGVDVAGTSSSAAIVISNAIGWTPSIQSISGCVSAASLTSTDEIDESPSDNTVNYTVGVYDALVGNTGTIVVRLSKAGEDPVDKTINVTQNTGAATIINWSFSASNTSDTVASTTYTWTSDTVGKTISYDGQSGDGIVEYPSKSGIYCLKMNGDSKSGTRRFFTFTAPAAGTLRIVGYKQGSNANNLIVKLGDDTVSANGGSPTSFASDVTECIYTISAAGTVTFYTDNKTYFKSVQFTY